MTEGEIKMETRKITIGIWLTLLILAALAPQSASAAIIYVDVDAPGDANGDNWEDAYTDLQTALDNASATDDIWVAQGTYHPNDADPNQESFELVHNVDVYGGYAGYGEADPNRRDWVNFVTILRNTRNRGLLHDVVVADEVTATVSGFTITDGVKGIYVWHDSSLTIKHCLITDNSDGIWCWTNSSINVADCRISENYFDGINTDPPGGSMAVLNCEIHDNGSAGITYDMEGSAVIKNNLIHHNGYGLLSFVPDPHVIRNNTIVDNGGFGVSNWGPSGTLALSNCIIWGNYDSALDPAVVPYALTYSCIDDSNYVSGPNSTIGDDPCFMHRFDFTDKASAGPNTIYVADASRYDVNDVIEYENDGVPRTVTDVNTDSNSVTFEPDRDGIPAVDILIHNWGVGETDVNENYHLRNDSCCVDAGDPCGTYTGETDIDGDDRMMNGDCNDPCVVDIGADELKGCWNCDSQCYGDGNCDDQVNLTDLLILKAAFASSEGGPDYDYCADFSRDGSVNLTDLLILKQYFGTDPNNDCNCAP
jgi:parallel beta-helix repeat protein